MADQDDGEDDDRVIYHPNRDKATSKATKSIVVLLLLVSAGLSALITIGGWKNLQGAKIVAVIFIIIFLGMAYYVKRWQRGVLPPAPGPPLILGGFAALPGVRPGGWVDPGPPGD